MCLCKMRPCESEVDLSYDYQDIAFHNNSDIYCGIYDKLENDNIVRSFFAGMKFLDKRRCSSRLKAIPEHKRPYYGCDSPSPKNKRSCTDLKGENSLKRISEDIKLETKAVGRPESTCFMKHRTSPANEILNLIFGKSCITLEVSDDVKNHDDMTDKISQLHNTSPKLIQERRCSPRLKSIPEKTRPDYGCTDHMLNMDSKSKELGSSKYVDGKRAINYRANSGPLSVKLEGTRRCSPRLKNIPEEKRPFYGYKPSNSPNDKACAEKRGANGMTRCIDGDKDFHSTTSVADPKDTIEIKINANLKWTTYDQFVAENISEKPLQGQERRITMITEMCKKISSNRSVRFDQLAGIPIGHKFFSRAELVRLGFHRNWKSGTEFIEEMFTHMETYRDDFSPVALAIVVSCHGNDNTDGLTEVVYFDFKTREEKCRAGSSGIIAFKNNIERNVPVKVILEERSDKSYSGIVYTYCGLYKVVKGYVEKGISRVSIGYQLLRLPDCKAPDPIKNNFAIRSERKGPSNLISLVCEDISFGVESLPIPVTNAIGFAKIVPPGFEYITSVQFSPNIKMPPDAPGCKCKSKCVNPFTCMCARRNGSVFPYVDEDDGRLVEPKDIVYECGPRCGCGPECINRVSQKPLKYRLEVFRTEKKGWAVRSWDLIPSGAPVCEYTGIIRRNSDLDSVSDNDFIFEIDCWHTMHGLGGRERRQGDDASNSNLKTSICNASEMDSEFCVDGSSSGNACRFINHSCDPNLFVQCVLSSHHDIRLARIVLFAADDIPPMQELTYDYGYALDSVVGADGKLKHMNCHCGSNICRGRLF